LVLNLYPNTKQTLKVLNDYPAYLRNCDVLGLA